MMQDHILFESEGLEERIAPGVLGAVPIHRRLHTPKVSAAPRDTGRAAHRGASRSLNKPRAVASATRVSSAIERRHSWPNFSRENRIATGVFLTMPNEKG